MAINRYDKPADLNLMQTYVPLPYQEIAIGLNARQKHQDMSREQVSILGTPINYLNSDAEKAKTQQNYWNTQMSDLENLDFTSPEANKALGQARRDYQYDKFYGETSKIEGRYNSYQAQKKEIIENKDMPESQKQYHLLQLDRSVQNPLGATDAAGLPLEGSGNPYAGDKFTWRPLDDANNFAKFMANQNITGLDIQSLPGLNYLLQSGKIEQVEYNRIMDGYLNYLSSDPNYRKTVQAELELSGVTPEEAYRMSGTLYVPKLDAKGNPVLDEKGKPKYEYNTENPMIRYAMAQAGAGSYTKMDVDNKIFDNYIGRKDLDYQYKKKELEDEYTTRTAYFNSSTNKQLQTTAPEEADWMDVLLNNVPVLNYLKNIGNEYVERGKEIAGIYEKVVKGEAGWSEVRDILWTGVKATPLVAILTAQGKTVKDTWGVGSTMANEMMYGTYGTYLKALDANELKDYKMDLSEGQLQYQMAQRYGNKYINASSAEDYVRQFTALDPAKKREIINQVKQNVQQWNTDLNQGSYSYYTNPETVKKETELLWSNANLQNSTFYNDQGAFDNENRFEMRGQDFMSLYTAKDDKGKPLYDINVVGKTNADYKYGGGLSVITVTEKSTGKTFEVTSNFDINSVKSQAAPSAVFSAIYSSNGVGQPFSAGGKNYRTEITPQGVQLTVETKEGWKQVSPNALGLESMNGGYIAVPGITLDPKNPNSKNLYNKEALKLINYSLVGE